MRNVLTTFIGVLLALLVFVGIRYAIRQGREAQQRSEEGSAEYEGLQRRENSAKESLRTADGRLSPMNNDEDYLWPPVLKDHEKWKVADLKRACGRPARVAIYTDEQMNIGGLDYGDASGNLVHFEFAPDGVTVSYADPKHVTNPDLIGSLTSIGCLSAVK
jgi:hypothetical protein